MTIPKQTELLYYVCKENIGKSALEDYMSQKQALSKFFIGKYNHCHSYDIFISYRRKDNKHDGWVTEFVDNLKGEGHI